MTPIFSLCHTTARIPDGWKPVVWHWLKHCNNPLSVEYILTTDEPIEFQPIFPSSFHYVNHGRKSNVDGWNLAARMSTGRVIITLSDDWFCPPHWDTLLAKAFPKDPDSLTTEPRPDYAGKWALDVDNCDNSDLMAFAIITRPYYESLGYLLHPDYVGLMSDTEFTVVAHRDQARVNARHLKFRHLNPDTGTVAWDDVYRLHRKPEDLRYGQEVFAKRERSGFPRESVLPL